MKSILDKSFNYTSSFQTDLAKTFARVRRQQRKDATTDPTNVLPIKQRAVAGRPGPDVQP
jgi:hypothetical protein